MAQQYGPGDALGNYDSDREAEEVVADGDEIRRIAVVAPGGQDGSEEGQQESRDEESGESASASRRTGILDVLRDVHVFDCIIPGHPPGKWGFLF